MKRVRPYLAEMTRALMVLALVLLNLAHQPGSTVAFEGFGFSSITVVNCGFSDNPSQTDHVPCHACRIGGDPVLPPAPCHSEPVDPDVVNVIYLPVIADVRLNHSILANRNRGPPTNA